MQARRRLPPRPDARCLGGPARRGDDHAVSVTPPQSWVLVCGVSFVASLLAWWIDPGALSWQRSSAASQPWRLWTAAFVHWSLLHLGVNLAAIAIVAAWGWRAAVSRATVWLWLACWPLVQAALWLRPQVESYGGMSGVLHAGIAVAAVDVITRRRGTARWIGAAVLAGLSTKVLLEAPWGPAVQRLPGWDIAVVPWSHACGTVIGTLLAWAWSVAEPLARRAPPAVD